MRIYIKLLLFILPSFASAAQNTLADKIREDFKSHIQAAVSSVEQDHRFYKPSNKRKNFQIGLLHSDQPIDLDLSPDWALSEKAFEQRVNRGFHSGLRHISKNRPGLRSRTE